MLKDRKIILGVTGCIAAYKSAYLVRQLKKLGANVQVIMTRSATQFITPLTMETLSEHPVGIEMFPERKFVGTHHITLAEWPDLFVIAPCTANVIGKIASGLADDLLTSVLMATRAKVLICPAMHAGMYENPILQENLRRLKEKRYAILEPEIGHLASGDFGAGRLPEVNVIVEKIRQLLSDLFGAEGITRLKDKKVLVTAGRTEESLDPVRFLSNRSSGRMGIALAEAARDAGATVTLIHGVISIPLPQGTTNIFTRTAEKMYQAVSHHFDSCDILIMCAAVADYTVEEPAEQKIKKTARELFLRLIPTTDILSAVSQRKKHQFIVGFSLDTEKELEQAREKMQAKAIDLMIINNPLESGAGFETETNKVTMLDSDGQIESLPLMRKTELAVRLMEKIAARLSESQ